MNEYEKEELRKKESYLKIKNFFQTYYISMKVNNINSTNFKSTMVIPKKGDSTFLKATSSLVSEYKIRVVDYKDISSKDIRNNMKSDQAVVRFKDNKMFIFGKDKKNDKNIFQKSF